MVRKSIANWARKIYPLRKLGLWIKQKCGWLGIPVIIPYRGYGNRECMYVSGSVSEDKGLAKPEKEHSLFINMLAMLKRYTSDEIPGVRVKAVFMGKEMFAITNQQGFFHFSFDIKGMVLPAENWQKIEFELLDIITPEQKKTTAIGEVLILKENDSEFGVISDIDDTILVSHSTNTIRKLRLMLFKNAKTRLPFEGVAGFYKALQKGATGKCHNPIFYVSSSQWNLYDLLLDFCKIRKIPDGPFLLQNLEPVKFRSLINQKKGIEKHIHKIEKIKNLLNTFNYLNFVLIGDSGQQDAEIYKKISIEFPGRVLAIYIRDIKKSKAKKINIIGKQLDPLGVEMLLIKDTLLAAMHAIELGLINKNQMEYVASERDRDHYAEIEI
ncbi:MAG: DUF2183 domain-containing protein [Bacteroidota bacterium]|nr:DUF2183 domain-containing protein [Bacteroidota bacterium]